MPEHSPIDGVSPDLNGVLAAHYLGTFMLPLEAVTCSVSTHPVSQAGVDAIGASIDQTGGFLDLHAPLVTIDASDIPVDGVNEETASTLAYKMMDGAHRFYALKARNDKAARFPFRVYRAYSHAHEAIISDALNGVSQAVVARGVADNVHVMNGILAGFEAEGVSDPSTTAIMQAYRLVGVTPPSKSTVRTRKKTVYGMTPVAYNELRTVQESARDDEAIHLESLTWTILSDNVFTSLKDEGKAPVQAAMIHLMARFKKRDDKGKALHASDLKGLVPTAEEMVKFTDRTTEVFGERAGWSEPLERLVHKLAITQAEAMQNIVIPWHVKQEAEVNNTSARLPEGSSLSASHAAVMCARPMPRIVKVAIKDPRMAEQYRRFQERDQRVRLAANVAENGEEDQDRDGGGDDPDMGTEFGGDDEDEAGSDEGEFEGQVEGGDGDVESKSTSQKKTTKGGASVAAAAVSASSDMAAKTKKKTSGKSSTPTLLPTGAADLTRGGVMESCMKENVSVREEYGLFRMTLDDLEAVEIRHPAKLVVLNIGATAALLDNTAFADKQLANLISTIRHNWLHPFGTLALRVPHPWFIHSGRLHDAIKQKGLRMHIEDNFLTVQYSTISGGRPSNSTADHLRNSQEGIMLVHLAPSGSKSEGIEGFTVNTRVTTKDVYGNDAVSPSTTSTSTLSGVQHEGKDVDIPRKAITFLVNRFTKQGDSCVFFNAECNSGLPVAISRGRKVEAFVTSPAGMKKMEDIARKSFTEAFDRGIFKVDRALSNERVVGPKYIPSGLPPDNTPQSVLELLAKVPEEGSGSEQGEADRCAAVAKDMARRLKYQIKVDADGMPGLFHVSGERYGPNRHEVLAWGKLRVFSTWDDAVESIDEAAANDNYVRLLRVGSNAVLRAMCKPGSEVVCSATAHLYLELSPTCPLFYARYADDESISPQMEMKSRLGSRKDWQSSVAPWHSVTEGAATITGIGCPVVASNIKESKGGTNPSEICIRPGYMVVRDVDDPSSRTPAHLLAVRAAELSQEGRAGGSATSSSEEEGAVREQEEDEKEDDDGNDDNGKDDSNDDNDNDDDDDEAENKEKAEGLYAGKKDGRETGSKPIRRITSSDDDSCSSDEEDAANDENVDKALQEATQEPRAAEFVPETPEVEEDECAKENAPPLVASAQGSSRSMKLQNARKSVTPKSKRKRRPSAKAAEALSAKQQKKRRAGSGGGSGGLRLR